MLLRSDADDAVTDWHELARLRRCANREQIVNDMQESHRQSLLNAAERVFAQCTVRNTTDTQSRHTRVQIYTQYNSREWRAVAFTGSTEELSTVVSGIYGPAFLGQPVAFLLSTRQPADAYSHHQQYISGRVNFVPKENRLNNEASMDKTGLAVHLVDQVSNMPSPYIYDGIQVSLSVKHSQKKPRCSDPNRVQW